MRYLIVGTLLLAARLDAQPLADRVARAPDGAVRLTFAARPGVCGNGSWITTHPRSDEWESDCDGGPVRVALRVRGGRVEAVRAYVGGRWREGSADGGAVTDLGTVGAPAAAELLLAVAERADGGAVADRALGAAALADGAAVWPTLLRIAKDGRAAPRLRRTAVHHLAQAAGEAVTTELGALAGREDEDLRVREAALHALGQRPRGEGIPALVRIAREGREPQLRKRAVHVLAQSNDPRAVALFEELLTK